MKELILLRGLPGSGKSEFANTLKAIALEGAVKEVAADDFRTVDGEYVFESISNKEAHNRCQERAEKWMKYGIAVVIVHNTFTQDWEMEHYMSLAEQYGYKVRTVVVENRHGSHNVHDVPAHAIRNMEDRFTVHLTPNPGTYTDLQDSVLDCLEKLKTVPQRLDYHPENWVYDHIGIVTGRMIANNESDTMIWTGLFHDLGKLETTRVKAKTGQLVSYGHDTVSAKYVEKFRDHFPVNVNVDKVHWLVSQHMRAKLVDQMGDHKREKLMTNPYWENMVLFGTYDDMVATFNSTSQEQRDRWIQLFTNWVNDTINF